MSTPQPPVSAVSHVAAVVDDDRIMREAMVDLLGRAARETGLSLEIRTFPSAEAFLFEVEVMDRLDLVFLDIEMPGLNGIRLAELIRRRELMTDIVFVTAYADYAVSGYKVDALDYLLKPIDSDKLVDVLEKWQSRRPRPSQYVLLSTDLGPSRRSVDEIRYLEAAGHKTLLHLDDGSEELLNDAFGELVERLGANVLLIHRSVAVNLDYVERLSSDGVHLSDGTLLGLSRRRRREVTDAFVARFGNDYRL